MDKKARRDFGRISGLHCMTDLPLKQLASWGDHLKVDHPRIDAEHEEIFKVAMEVAEAWQHNGPLDEVRALTDKLERVLEGHFRYEEAQLAAAGYPQNKLVEHSAEHRLMLEKLNTIRNGLKKMGTGPAPLAPGLVVHRFVLEVVMGHLCNSDLGASSFMLKAAKSNGQALRAA